MKDIVVCLFASSGFDKAAQGLTGEGRLLADQASGKLRIIIVGSSTDALAAEVAAVADTVILADQPELSEYQPEMYLAALVELCRQQNARVVLLASDTYSQEIAPRLAHRLGGSAIGDGSEVKLNGETVRVIRQVYGGKAQALVELRRSPAVASLRSRSFAPATPGGACGEVRRVSVGLPAVRSRIVEYRRDDSGMAKLEDARVIVSGGRGIGGAEPFTTELRPLADKLGAQLGASRAACDAGWVPATWQVGQTGKKVAPELYLAIALSGSSQHMAGVSEAKNIVAINTDREAPIFKYCRFGLVADYRKVVPLLRARLG